MPPCKLPAKNTPITPTLTPPPPPQFDAVMFQTIVTVAVTAALTHFNSGGTRRGGTSINYTQGDSHTLTKWCTYKDFINYKPEMFNGTGGIMTLSQWFEKTESIFEICSCPKGSKVKFAAYTFSAKALTWWNGHVKSLTLVVANGMGWETLKDLMTKEYCPRDEVQKLEEELWRLKMKVIDIVTYTTRFSELVTLCLNMVPSKIKKIERYIWGLLPPFQGNVLSSNPTTFNSAKDLVQRLIDHEDPTTMTTTTIVTV